MVFFGDKFLLFFLPKDWDFLFLVLKNINLTCIMVKAPNAFTQTLFAQQR
jgi:hypothetical protein